MEIRKKRIIGGAAGAAAGLLIGLGTARMLTEVYASASEPCGNKVGNVAMANNVAMDACTGDVVKVEDKREQPAPPELPPGLVVSFVTLVGLGIGSSLPDGGPKAKPQGEPQHMQAA